jgi:predicted nucleic acid-binding protein
MKCVFADSFYFFALINRNEPQHAKAMDFASTYRGEIILTDWILVELADGLCRGAGRRAFAGQYDFLRGSERVQIVEASEDTLTAGIELYRNRPDKDWSLTDCVSFVVMERESITEALTGDHHFEQAGFVPLLK